MSPHGEPSSGLWITSRAQTSAWLSSTAHYQFRGGPRWVRYVDFVSLGSFTFLI